MAWDDKKWRRMQHALQEQEEQGDEKLTQMVTSMTDYVTNMQTTLGTLPNYLPLLMKPNDPAKSPEQNNIDRDTIIATMKTLDDNQKLLTQTYEFFNKYIKGKLPIEKQNNVEATYADKIEKHETKINWSLAANEIRNLIYSISPSPGAWTMTKERKRLKILSASIQEIDGEEGVLLKNQFVGCGLKSLKIIEVQPEGKKAMPFEDYLRGKNFSVSERIFD